MARIALTPTEQTLFAELLQQVETALPAGTIYKRERDGIQYYYAKIPVGVERIDTFIGKVGDTEAEAKIAELRRGMEQAGDRRRLISLLRRTGLAAPQRTLGATLDAISHAGLFGNGAVLVGTAAYMMSEPLVGRKLPEPTLMTGDLDLATANLAIKSEPPERLVTIIKRGDPTFEPVLHTRPKKPPSRFRTADGFLLDLITPTRRRTDTDPMPMDGLSAGAAPLQQMDWLIADPVPTVALWGSGVLVNVPQPARFAVHKLILAQKRNLGGRLKRQKDLMQADALIDALQLHDPYALHDSLVDAATRGRAGWLEPIFRSLAELERQDIAEELGASVASAQSGTRPNLATKKE
jgi:hypothetical protein